MELEIHRLNLTSPLYYIPAKQHDPFGGRGETEYVPGREELFCFELDLTQYRSFEPDKEKLLGNLAAGGEAVGGAPGPAHGTENNIFELPRGNYLFAQKREICGREKIITMAIEIQQEGLWQRLIPSEKLYLRFLYEDGSRVTQLFRPYIEPGKE